METAITCSYLARTTCLVFNFAPVFIFFVSACNGLSGKTFLGCSFCVWGAFLSLESATFTVSGAFLVIFRCSIKKTTPWLLEGVTLL